MSLPIVYLPGIFVIVMGFLHFVLFLVLCILAICLPEPEEPGKGAKVMVTRALWGGNISIKLFLVMCLINVILIIAGMVGTATVLVAVV